MQALSLPANRGWQWLVEGHALFRRQPALIGLMVMSYWLALLFFNILPVVGPVLASLIMPGLSVGVMTACRNVDRGYPITFQVFFQPLRETPRPLILLGGLYLLSTITILSLTALVDGGVLLEAMTSGKGLNDESLDEKSVLLSTQFVLVLLIPLLMAYWYAPALAAWHRLPVFKALFFSFVACLRNWRPFLVYGLALLGLGAFLPGLVIGIVGALIPGAASFMASLITLPLLLILAPTVFASFYISYRDVFVISEHA